MTIALGILASDGLAIAADTQETTGYWKGFALKVHSAMTQSDRRSPVNSAIAITGAGSAFYLDAIALDIIRGFHRYQDSTLAAFETHLTECVETFHAKHVTPLPAHLAREVNLIVGVQIEGQNALWGTDVSAVRPSRGLEVVGTGGSYARMAIHNRCLFLNVQSAAVLSILGVMHAKEFDQDCGKNTTVTLLKDNLAYTVPLYLVEEAERLFMEYAGMEQSAFFYALGKESPDDGRRPQKLTRRLRQLRKDFTDLGSRFLETRP